jgi:hypothetical protein
MKDENNRGLNFDPEMAPYCGKTFRVQDGVTSVVDEKTGNLLHMKQPSIRLAGVFCSSE